MLGRFPCTCVMQKLMRIIFDKAITIIMTLKAICTGVGWVWLARLGIVWHVIMWMKCAAIHTYPNNHCYNVISFPGGWSFYTLVSGLRPHPREGYNHYITCYLGNITVEERYGNILRCNRLYLRLLLYRSYYSCLVGSNCSATDPSRKTLSSTCVRLSDH